MCLSEYQCLFVSVSRLQVRENGRQKVCVAGLMENEVHDLNALVRVSSFNNVQGCYLISSLKNEEITF